MPFRRTEEVDTNTIGEGRPDFTGLTQLVRTVGTVTQRNILGTLTQITKVEDIGTLDVLKKVLRPTESGTVESSTVGGVGTIGPQTINANEARQVTFGFNTDVAMSVNHELKIGDQWVTDGSSSIPTDGHVTTISHNFSEWRAVRTDGNADADVTVTYEARN